VNCLIKNLTEPKKELAVSLYGASGVRPLSQLRPKLPQTSKTFPYHPLLVEFHKPPPSQDTRPRAKRQVRILA